MIGAFSIHNMAFVTNKSQLFESAIEGSNCCLGSGVAAESTSDSSTQELVDLLYTRAEYAVA